MSICVLLVEHDERVLHQLGRGLRDAGFLVMPLGDAEQAIDLLCLVAFDLVLADTSTLRYAGAGGTNPLTALVQTLRNAPLLLFTTATTQAPGAPGAPLLLEQPLRDRPRLVAAIDLLLRDRPPTHAPLAAHSRGGMAPHFDAGDVDDLAFPPLLSIDDDGGLAVRQKR
jgi:CheY-like chemotaxis protein